MVSSVSSSPATSATHVETASIGHHKISDLVVSLVSNGLNGNGLFVNSNNNGCHKIDNLVTLSDGFNGVDYVNGFNDPNVFVGFRPSTTTSYFIS